MKHLTKQPEKIFDIHCHMFNLKYLPVAGIIVRYAKTPHLIAKGLEWLLLKNTAESFYTQKEKFIYSDESKDFNIPLYEYLDEKKFDFEMSEIFNFTPDDSIKAIEDLVVVGDLLEGDLRIALDEYENLYEHELKKISFLESKSIKNKVALLAGRLRRMLEKIINGATSFRNYLNWFIFMTNSEENIYDYINKIDEQGVEKYLHLMMDVDHFLNENPQILKYKSSYDFENVQIANMHQLNTNHDNLVGFVAFNPARENCMEIVKKAIEMKFVGVKFYPPLGYKPYGDEKYEKRIEELMVYCEIEKIPLFTHCNNQGFEAWPNEGHSGYNSNPVFWERVLIEHPNLILCLAHGGGVEGWFSVNQNTDKLNPDEILANQIANEKEIQEDDWNKSYAAMVFKLCVKYNNVFCDAAYLDEMINSNGSFEPIKKANFKKRLLKLFESQPKFAKKIMYGSDWHMLFQEGKNKVYLKNYIEFFSDDEFDNYRDDFFYKNAYSYLKL